jgi:hypothetical protein
MEFVDKENEVNDSITLKYDNDNFYIQNNKINNKKLYFEIRKLCYDFKIFKKYDSKFYFSQNLFLFFLEMCNKYGTKIIIN